MKQFSSCYHMNFCHSDLVFKYFKLLNFSYSSIPAVLELNIKQIKKNRANFSNKMFNDGCIAKQQQAGDQFYTYKYE